MNVFDLFAKLSLDTSDYDKKLGESKSGLSAFGDAIKNGVGTAVKVTSAAVVAGATATAAIVKSAVDSYAEYEQLVGGVETLFKDAGATVIENAGKAFTTAGLSANQYMDTVTSFSASLISSLGEDTAKAAEYADRAIVDMADNANKMGTSIDSIQNAYSGFAKQNYTMLDNLKLGYGGTKEEMERLIKDASSMTDEMEKLGVSVDADSMSFDNIINAISVMQEHLGIAGATASEASTTIEGSINAMKGAWQNLIVGVADDTQDFDALVENFVTSVDTAGKNILPRVETALKGAGKLVETLLPEIVNRAPELINDVLPSLLESGANMVTTIVEGLAQSAPQLIEGAKTVVLTIADAFFEMGPELLSAGMTIVEELGKALVQNLPVLIPAAVEMAFTIMNSLLDNIDMIIDVAIDIVMALSDGIINALPVLIEKMPEVVDKLVTAIVVNAPKLLEAGFQIIVAFTNALISNAPKIIVAALEIVVKLVAGLLALVTRFGEVGKEFIENLKQGIKNAEKNAINQIVELASGLVSAITDKVSEMASAGLHLVEGIWQGISNGYGWITGKIKGWVGDVIAFIKSAFGIHSPSTVMRDEVGRYLAEGIWEGYNQEDVFSQIQADIDGNVGKINVSASASGGGSIVGGIDYDKLGSAMANALVESGLSIKLDKRELGRVVRSVSYA